MKSQSTIAMRHGTGRKNRFHVRTIAALVRTNSAIVSSVIAAEYTDGIVSRSMRTIALLTDFGTRDPYVAAMKGVIAARCEHRQECLCHTIVDLTHDIAPFDVWEAAFFLRDVVRYWPNGTIFVCVVDPGVGTARQIITVESDGRIFLAPDNGLLHFVDGDAYDVANDSLFL